MEKTKLTEGQLDCSESAPCVEVAEGAQWVVVRDGCADLRFAGRIVAEDSSRENSGPCSIRWDVLKLYRTQAGAWVCSREYLTLYAEEQDSQDGAVCVTHAEVIQFFGYSLLAKGLYAAAHISCAEVVA